MKVLFIGNSYTFYYDLPAMFQALANENEKDVSAFSVTEGGRRLIKFKDQTDPYTVALDNLLEKEHFDVVFFQEQSVLPAADYATFFEGLEALCAKVMLHADRGILYSTWGRRPGSQDLEKFGWTNEMMTDLLEESYTSAANKLGLGISYVGPAFRRLRNSCPELELYDPDGSHPSRLGSCLACVCHYKAVFGKLPEHFASLQLSHSDLAAVIDSIE